MAKRDLFAISGHQREAISGIRYRSHGEVKRPGLAKLSKKRSHRTPALPIGFTVSEMVTFRRLDFELITLGIGSKSTSGNPKNL